MHLTLLDASHPHWGTELERIGVELRAGANPELFPYHFLYVTLSKIGGRLVVVGRGAERCGIGFLFPRSWNNANPAAPKTYTFRYHVLTGASTVERTRLIERLRSALDGDLVYYDPSCPGPYAETHAQTGAVDLGRPSAEEAMAIRNLQGSVWGSPPEFLYPADIHSVEFRAGTSLMARVDGRPAGFLIGFYKFGGAPLPSDWETRFRGSFRLESQTMGVLPEYRGLRIANLLKKAQAQLAQQDGIGVINWTADPLQYPNAALNFGLLRAIAFEFARDLYPFRNELNRVHASRLSLTWLITSRRVQQVPVVGSHATVVNLAHQPHIPRINDGFRHADFTVDAELIAIEIPADWTILQQLDLEAATRWRMLTDSIFQHYVGRAPGQYVITGAGTDGERRYLLAERVSPTLWERLGQVD